MEIAAAHEIPEIPAGTLNRSRSVDVAVAGGLFRSEAAMPRCCVAASVLPAGRCAHVVALATVLPVTMTPGLDSEGSRLKH
jgi:hypothetical protein